MKRIAIQTYLAILCLSLLLSVSASAATPQEAADPLMPQSFEVHYRSLGDAADLVSELLSPDGTLTLNPRLKLLVVEDRAAVLRRVEALLKSFDLPPRSADVTIHLFLGHREEAEVRSAGGGEFSKEVRGVVETLGDFTKWTRYEPLGSRSITGVEGEPVEAELSAEFRVAFTVEAVHQSQAVVKFERFSLQRVVQGDDGKESIEDLYTAGMVVDVGKLTLVIAANAPDSQRALFLALQVAPR